MLFIVGEDFNTTNENLFSNEPGVQVLCFTFFPIDDANLESTEDVIISASTNSDDVSFPPGGNRTVIQIIDDGKDTVSEY